MMIKLCFLRKTIQTGLLFMYFFLMSFHNLSNHSIMVDYVWKLVLFLCFMFGVLHRTIIISNKKILFVLGILFSTFANFAFIGNASVFDSIYPLFYLGVYQLLIDDKVDNRIILLSIYLNCVVLSFVMLKCGIGQAIFDGFSNNFLSVVLFAPTIVYYARMEYYQQKISLYPVIAVFVTCILALGRGGILASGSLLLLILGYLFFLRNNWDNKQKQTRFRIIAIIVLLIVTIWAFLSPFTIQALEVFKRFDQYGMYGTGRIEIWCEYLNVMLQKPDFILFGTSFLELPLMLRFNNNLHNSFFNIHAYYGLLAVLYILYMFISNCKLCIMEKRWLYLMLMIVFFMRSFTDKIFGGGSVATPILFFVLWYIKDKRWKTDTSR